MISAFLKKIINNKHELMISYPNLDLNNSTSILVSEIVCSPAGDAESAKSLGFGKRGVYKSFITLDI